MSAIATLAQSPLFLALDWGTSSLRAYAMGAGGEVLAERRSIHGIMNLLKADSDLDKSTPFERSLQALCGDWLEAYPQAALLACGMVGSAQGWKEATYLEVPMQLGQLTGRLTVVDRGQAQPLHIVPGLLQNGELPNVMRGEETQIAGVLQRLALDHAPASKRLIGLPGTHSKWAWVDAGCVQHFATFMTGEVFAALRGHTILGRTMDAEAATDVDAFERGLQIARSPQGALGVLSTIFSCRTLGLTGRLSGAAQREYLSGLLIGYELHALSQAPQGEWQHPVILCGEADLCGRYASALTLYGFDQPTIYSHVTALGLWRMAQASGLV